MLVNPCDLYKYLADPPRLCALDEELGVVIHRFAPGATICRCGCKIVRNPHKKQNRVGWYGKGKPWSKQQ